MTDKSRADISGYAQAGHDTQRGDPKLKDNPLIALYDSVAHAHAAENALLAAGVDQAAVQVIDRNSPPPTPTITVPVTAADPPDRGILGDIASLFAPHKDNRAYAHALAQGHAIVVVNPAQTANRARIIGVLQNTHPIDFDAKLEQWRQAGYDYTSANALHPETSAGAATATRTVPGMVTDASGDKSGPTS